MDDLIHNEVDEMYEIETFARLLHIHPTHLTNTIRELSGTSACGLFQLKIIEKVLQLLANSNLSIKDIALQLTYEPSQFTKWFKRIIGITPKQYRSLLLIKGQVAINSEMMTILRRYADIALHL